ncbi:MAG TPA: haloalkane dehalogenase [Pyrinomonadaceae bacterium]|nr:haloalkane dehalogenase [Pyrinomonadaceae bacterium]
MRDFSKALLRFSWAMPLLGFQQLVKFLREPNRSMDIAATTLNSMSQTAEQQFGELAKNVFKSGDELQAQLVDGLFGAFAAGVAAPAGALGFRPAARPRGYKSDPLREEVIARYTRGTGQFSADKKFIALRMKMYKLSGEEDGYHEGVWEAQFKDPKELLARPAKPEGPMNEPVGPVPHPPVMAQTQAHWVFGDQSSIIVAGPATSHLVPLPDGSFIFMVSTAQIITGGTGRFEGAYGLVQSLGSTHVPKGLNLFGPQDVSFTATTIDTFRVVRSRYHGTVPTARPQPSPHPQPSALPSPDYPYTPHYVEVHGWKMHYLDEGVGDPILFLHGNPTWSYLWRNVIPHVKTLGRCIVPDLIGMGWSDKPQIEYSFFDQFKYLEGFINKLGLRKVTLVLHDWGTALGFHYAMANEKNVRGIAFMEALLKPYDSWNDFPASLRDTFQGFRGRGAGWELIVDKNVMIEQVLPGSMLRKLSDGEMSSYREPFKEPNSRKPIWQFIQELPVGGAPGAVASLVSRYSEKLQRSTLPKLLIYAEPGAITTAEDVAWARENLKNISVVNIGPGIHFHQEDNPAGVGEAIAAWYQQIK